MRHTSVLVVALALHSPAAMAASTIAFEPNLGQGGEHSCDAHYFARGPGFFAAIAPDGMAARLHSGAIVRTQLVGADAAAPGFERELLGGQSHYFRGRAAPVTGVPRFARAGFEDVWPGIDVVYHQGADGFEYDFVVAAGADPRQIRLEFDGIEGASISGQGELVLRPGAGESELRERQPRAFQELAGRRVEVTARWQLTGPRTAVIRVGHFDRRAPLLIDPTLAFSTYLGGDETLNGDIEEGFALALDAAGFVYVGGPTSAANFPVKGGAQQTFGDIVDGFVAKIDPRVPEVVWASYLGGDDEDQVSGISVDASGRVTATGYAASTNFPLTPGALQTTIDPLAVYAGFVTRFAPDGASLEMSTLLGGDDITFLWSVATDGSGRPVVAGESWATNMPVLNGFQSLSGGGDDGYVAMLASDGSSLVWGTYYGGVGEDGLYSLVLEPAGRLLLGGFTDSINLPAVRPLQGLYGGGFSDGVVAALDVTGPGPTILFSSWLGGAATDWTDSVASGQGGRLLAGGSTRSNDFPLASSIQATLKGITDGFVASIDTSNWSLTFSTYLGGMGEDYVRSVADSGSGAIYAGGDTDSADFPTVNPLQPALASVVDGFVSLVDPAGAGLIYSTYLGGGGDELGRAVASLRDGRVWFTGETQSADWPVQNPIQSNQVGGTDAFVAAIDYAPPRTCDLRRDSLPSLTPPVDKAGLFSDMSCPPDGRPSNVVKPDFGSAPTFIDLPVLGEALVVFRADDSTCGSACSTMRNRLAVAKTPPNVTVSLKP